jgi:hypothetical protein
VRKIIFDLIARSQSRGSLVTYHVTFGFIGQG